MRMPSARTIVVSLGAVLVLAQLIRPARTNPPVDPTRTIQANTVISPEVLETMNRACRDCHSNETDWPWYSQVAPASWLLVSHVNSARRHLSFSTWADYSTADATDLLGEMCEEVRDGQMPMSSYVLIHRSAALADGDRQAICQWTERERARIAAR